MFIYNKDQPKSVSGIEKLLREATRSLKNYYINGRKGEVKTVIIHNIEFKPVRIIPVYGFIIGGRPMYSVELTFINDKNSCTLPVADVANWLSRKAYNESKITPSGLYNA